MIKKINKKKCIVIAIVAFVVSFGMAFIGSRIVRSCNPDTTTENKVAMVGDTITSEGKVMEFEYDNHKFINIVKASENGSVESFVVHDPNCRCTTKKLNNITTVITNTDNKNSHASDSISKANFRVVLSKLNQLSTEVKALRTEVAQMKKVTTKPIQKKIVKKVTSNKKTKK